VDVPRWFRRRLTSPDPFGRDALLAAGLLLVTAVEIVPLRSLGGWEPRPPAVWPLLAVATVAPLAWRRRRPIAVAAVQAAAATATVPLSGHLEFSGVLVVSLLIGPYSAGAYASRRAWSLAVVLAGGIAPELMHGLSWWLRSGVPGVGTVLPLTAWLIGHSARAYRRQLADLRERARRLERERDATARAAVAEERARIARELHDVVAHGVSVMVVQSEAARRLLRRRPDQAEAALRTVSATGAEALIELRHVLGLLAGEGGELELEPTPRLDDLDALVERVRSAGLVVELHLDGEPRALPRGLDLAAYRIVQEALTNVLKHAGTSRAEVRLRYADDSLSIDVTDAGRSPVVTPAEGAGRGLVGMRERVAAYGGELEAGPRSEGGYAVRARLPLELAV
jgi:signal transduction histidine kinase